MKIITSALLATLFLLSPLMSQSLILVDTGYRYDRLDESFFVEDISLGFFASTNRQFKNIQSYTLGTKIWTQVPCSSVFLKGSGHYSWLLSGHYNQEYFERANINGHFWDAKASIGYLFPLCDTLVVGPLVGFSYDLHHFRMSDATFPTAGVGPLASEGARWSTTLYAPYIGFDLYFKTLCLDGIDFDATYEFHNGWTRISWHQSFNDPIASIFSYTANLTDMYGHVFSLGAKKCLCSRWVIGLNAQYTLWQNRHSELDKVPPPNESGFTAVTVQRTVLLSWRSFSATIDLGVRF